MKQSKSTLKQTINIREGKECFSTSQIALNNTSSSNTTANILNIKSFFNMHYKGYNKLLKQISIIYCFDFERQYCNFLVNVNFFYLLFALMHIVKYHIAIYNCTKNLSSNSLMYVCHALLCNMPQQSYICMCNNHNQYITQLCTPYSLHVRSVQISSLTIGVTLL